MKKHVKKSDSAKTKAALLPCMDYLHGDVVDNEYEAACAYEYARESAVLRKTAEMHKRGVNHELDWTLDKEFDCGTWFNNEPWSSFFECPSFPEKGWNQLSESERKEILHMGGFQLPSHVIQPLRMNEVWLLNAHGIFDKFKAMAEKQREDKRKSSFCPPGSKPQPQARVYPVIEGWPARPWTMPPSPQGYWITGDKPAPLPAAPGKTLNTNAQNQWVHALFTIDFSKSKKQLTREFGKWLDLTENEVRLVKHKRNLIGKTGVFKDRLKDLASWRIYGELGCEDALRFADENRLRDKTGKPRKFHDPRQGQCKELALNQAPLYSEESGFLKAKTRAKDYLAELTPWEFGKYAKGWEQRKAEFHQRIQTELKRAKKISKRNS